MITCLLKVPMPLHCIGKLRVLKAKGPGSLACFWHLAHGEINSTFKLQSKCTHIESAGKHARSQALTWSHWLSPSAGCTWSSFTRFMFVYAGVVILGFHSYCLDFSFNLFIWKNMNSFGPENIWVVLLVVCSFKITTRKTPANIQKHHPATSAWRTSKFSLILPVPFQPSAYFTAGLPIQYFVCNKQVLFSLTFPFSVPEQKKTTFPATSSIKILCVIWDKNYPENNPPQ